MDRGAWRATVHRVAKSLTPLKQLSMHACIRVFSPELQSQSAVQGDCQMVSKNKEVQKALLSTVGLCGGWIQMAFTFSFIE